jgi:hypothetical protein
MSRSGRALTNDALITISAGRLGIRVITANQRDYSRLTEFRTFHWEVAAVQANTQLETVLTRSLGLRPSSFCRRGDFPARCC